MLMADKTSERLRSKHVRTLELLQKTLDENAELRDRVSQLQKGTLHLGREERQSNRTNDLEDEINRLKAEHCANLLATEEAARVRRDELQKSIDALVTKQQKLQNELFSLETKLGHARGALQSERDEWHSERQRIVQENQSLRHEIEREKASHDTASDSNESLYVAELTKLKIELDTQRRLQADFETRNDRLHDEIAGMCVEMNRQKETSAAFVEQLEAARQQINELVLREATVSSQLKIAHDEIRDLDTTVEKLRGKHASTPGRATLSPIQQQYTAALTQLQAKDEQNQRLIGENQSLHDSLAKLQTHHAELTRTNSANGSIFATHVDLKRENFHLRAQIDELKALQRRFLTTANKKTMKFPAL